MNSEDLLVFSVIGFFILVGAVGIYLLARLAKRDRVRLLLRRKTPMPRERGAGSAYAFAALADWQADAGSALASVRKSIPATGPHLLARDADVAILRSAGDHLRRIVLVVFLFVPLMGASLLVLIKKTARFILYPADRGYTSMVQTESGVDVQHHVYDLTFANYLRSLTDDFQFYFSEIAIRNLGGLGKAIQAFLLSDPFFLSLFVALLVLTAVVIVPRTAPPLAFDRRRDMIYTVRRGRLYAAPWSKAMVTMAAIGRNTSPAFALADREGSGGTRWFSLAAWGDFHSPVDDSHLVSVIDPSDRWVAQLEWLEGFRAGSPDLQGSAQAPQPMRLLLPREGRLPEGLPARLDMIKREKKRD